jgi:hypothetical protein
MDIMQHNHRGRWRFSLSLGASLTLSGLLPGWAVGADTPPPALTAPAEVRVFTLADCLTFAHEHQPSIHAAASSLAAAGTQLRALDKLHTLPLVPGSRELPFRRQQATLGVCIAQAGLSQAEHDVAFAVTRTYLAVQYARAQLAVTQELVSRLEKYSSAVEAVVEDKEARIKERASAGQIVLYFRLARSRNEEAKNGVGRALAALREAMGAGPDCCFEVPNEDWFRVQPKGQPPFLLPEVCKGDVIALALSRRGEIQQTATLVDVHHLEVDAQGANCLPTVHTFAAGADIHARPVPPAFEDTNIYRPGALAPEMPTLLVGPKCERQERAQEFADRAAAVAEKARNLVALEAEEAYWRWVETRARALETYKGAVAALVLQDPEFEKGFDVKEDAVKNLVFAAQGRAGYNEALYHYLLTLAGLERVTAGGFCSGLMGEVAPK